MIQNNGSVISEVKIHFLMSISILVCTLHFRDIKVAKKPQHTHAFSKEKFTFKYFKKRNVKRAWGGSCRILNSDFVENALITALKLFLLCYIRRV